MKAASTGTVCAIMQPTYLPWLGYFDLIDQVDTFVFLDNVQLEKSSWQTRNRIKTHEGALFLSVDRQKCKGLQLPLLNATLLNEQQQWRQKHLRSIANAYRKAPFFAQVYAFIETLLQPPLAPQSLSELNISMIRQICVAMGITTPCIQASDLLPTRTEKTARLIDMCTSLGCETYLSPPGAWGYLNELQAEAGFAEQGITLRYHTYHHPMYPQLYPPFGSHLSVLDLLFNVGFEQSLQLIRTGRQVAQTHHELHPVVNDEADD